MVNPHHETLARILRPQLLTAVHDLFFAWADGDEAPDGPAMLRNFNDAPIEPEMYDLCFAAGLQPLSEIPLAEFPASLLPYLPPPEDAGFAAQAAGLHILLDQAPRMVLRGLDSRYTFGHLGPLGLRWTQELAVLPPHLQPGRLQRWRSLGYDFERAWLRVSYGSTAWVHAEDAAAQRAGQELVETECRQSAERHYARTDPLRELDAADREDTLLFARLVGKIEDDIEQQSRAEAMWRMCRIDRVHEPIIRVFGRYPYRNGILGRDNAAGEAEWVEATGRFGACAPEIAEKVKQDVDAGRWTPLQGGRPER